MANKLTQMEIEEISLVDDPANGDAKVVIVKAKNGKAEDFEPCPGCTQKQNCMAKGYCMAKAAELKGPMSKLRETLDGLATDDDDRSVVENAVDELLKSLTTSGNNAAAAADFQEIAMDLEQLTKALEDAEQKLADLEKRATDSEAALAEAQDVIKAKDEELAKGKTKKGDYKKEQMTDEEEDDEEVMKSLPESIRKRLEETEAKAKEASEQLAKMKDEAETKEAIAKAKDLGFGDADKVGPLLLRVAKGKTTAEDAALVEQLLKSAGQVTDKSILFKSMGSDAAVDGDPEALLKAKAEEIRKANEKLSPEQAYAQALEQNPQLYNAYIAKRRV
jgi:hypothetical protein